MVTQQELHLLNVMGGFQEIAGFTNVIGAIDGTHIESNHQLMMNTCL